ncbi:ABC-three component system protein [Georgenia satyanarayanai]|nr:ABC-three component system protein [Georgenia satyanarayanai]
MRALAELGKRASVDPAVVLRLEVLDDIDFNSGGSASELLQTKHHLGETEKVTAKSVDFWRTMNVWMDLSLDERPLLRMVTTQIADEDLGLLRPGADRDSPEALRRIVEAASASGNKKSQPWRDRFLQLDAVDQLELVDRIVIDDATPSASGLDSELIQTFRYAVTPGKEKAFLALLKGWWAGIAVRLLDRTLPAVTGNDLAVEVADIVDQLRLDNLPVDPDVRQRFDESITEAYKDRQFVQQLLWVALDRERLWKAIRDYHRSYSQRSFWLRYQLVGEQELDRFAFKLYDEWEQVFDAEVGRALDGGRTAEEVGQEIMSQLARTSRARLRDRFDEPWFNRGMFQALADGELGYRIGWHPDFQSRLEGLLTGATV